MYTLTIRKGVEWNTTPPRQVTAADARRGLERTCNPAEPFGGVADYEGLIAGMPAFCSAFEKVKPTVPAIKQFLATHSIAGVIVNPANPLQISFKLVHPESYFTNLLAMAAFTPAPIEELNYLPASAALAQHTISDGPYEVQSYVPTRSITFVRNPVWKASLDPISKAYVDEIKVIETDSATSVQQQLQTNSPNADLEWGDTPIPPAQLPALLAAHNPGVYPRPHPGPRPVRHLQPEGPQPQQGDAERQRPQGDLLRPRPCGARHRRRRSDREPAAYAIAASGRSRNVELRTSTPTTRRRPSRCSAASTTPSSSFTRSTIRCR